MLGFCPRTLRRLALCAVGVTAILTSTNAAWCWETAHGKPDNTSMVDVATAPAQSPRKVDNIGTIAPGAGPVVAPDGTVYLGNEQGKVMSFKPDGTAGWSRDLNPGETILASPLIGSDGSVYVIGVKRSTDPVKRLDATLHRFTAGGGWAGQTPFPEHGGGGGGTAASPNLWRFNGVELIMVPAPYRRDVGGGIDIRLLAFSTNGALVADQRATSIVPEIHGGAILPVWFIPLCLTPPGFIVCASGAGTDFTSPSGIPVPPPLPGVGLHTNPRGGTPWILLSDHYKDFVGFTFSLADYKFYEVFRVHDEKRFMRSAPSFIPEQHSIIGVEDIDHTHDGGQVGAKKGGVVFSGPNQANAAPITGLPPIYAPATRLWDGRTALVGAPGELVLLNGRQVTARVSLAGASIVPAAASRTHVFLSTETAFQTFDPQSLTEIGRVEWNNGGKSPPVIGPQGHVYAVADQTLFVFGRPLTSNANGGGGGGPVVVGGGVLEDTGTPAPQPTSQAQAYKPPFTTNGNRLFACEELDGDDCGKGDYRSIAKAFCAKNGFANADDIDVDSKKVKAETLDGQYCTKKKCKVFDQIVCRM
ncbi:MAG: PQQ-like beta-propeller repeat protein [Rhodospirillales bacterium]|nr:PQQ-like beta-propeller repeat protein [Rhodospirillales bacterium]